MKTVKTYYRIERSEISYLRFILEAYDGVGVLTTIDAGAGVVMISAAPDCRAEVDMILNDLKKTILIERLDEKELQLYL